MKILVADDSKTNLAIISTALEQLGHTVIATHSGEEAISEYEKNKPDLIILDVVMEGMSGFECASKIRAMNTEENWIPIIFLSASVDDQSISQGINAGGDDYLTKPFSQITLEAKIKAMQRIAEMKKKLLLTTEELKVLSSTDPLTGTYNRLQFEKSIKEKIATADRQNLTLGLLFIDLDHFKAINDTFGHNIGDLLIREVADRIKECVRIDDFIARIGGDEFVIMILDKDTAHTAEVVAKKILDKLAQPFTLENNTIRISSSIGLACYPYNGLTRDTLVQSADIAMYHAKELGRNNFQNYTNEMNQKYRRQVSLEQELRFALERSQLFIVYQPIYNLISKQIVGMEGLLRWKHNSFGIISPNIFIPIAEECGLIMQIGNWVLENVCQQGAKWNELGFDHFKLSVNLSAHQIHQNSFIDTLNSILIATKFSPRQLELELTEPSLVSFTNQLKTTITKLHDMGVNTTIDDFGTRYSSLSYLRSFPISSLKIDKEFLINIQHDVKNSIIVKSLISLAVNLNLNVIAEGIENDEQIQFLIINGCFLGQGYYLSKPISANDMTNLLMNESKSNINVIP